ncbi:peroxiredoxin family protein [Sphaerisporangium fuscum]|uniref:peroxiredoxin family protein n=1 Tax=Sphaerisporangium fuscum TaxID=2835868 RepID=UPI001BDD9EAF|nr:hypothetical protein [Sphaerisporangium fuscum]
MSAEWAAIVLLTLLGVADSAAVVVLLRRRGAAPAASATPVHGPVPGTRFALDAPVRASASDRVLFALISPTCGVCTTMLPTFAAATARADVVLVSAAEEEAVREYLAGHAVELPLVIDPQVFDANDIPWPPFAVVTDGAGVVLAAGGASEPEHVEQLLARAEALRPARPFSGPAAPPTTAR